MVQEGIMKGGGSEVTVVVRVEDNVVVPVVVKLVVLEVV